MGRIALYGAVIAAGFVGICFVIVFAANRSSSGPSHIGEHCVHQHQQLISVKPLLFMPVCDSWQPDSKTAMQRP